METDKATGNIVLIELDDKMLTRILDIQENDKEKWQETVEHIFLLGVKARENSIKASRERKFAEAKAASMLLFNKALAQNPNLRKDPNALLAVMQAYGIIEAAPQQPAAPQPPEPDAAAADKSESASAS